MVDFLLAVPTPYTKSYLDDLIVRFTIKYTGTRLYRYDLSIEFRSVIYTKDYSLFVLSTMHSYYFMEWETFAYEPLTLPKNYRGKHEHIYSTLRSGQ
jgi:hypothetical protein